MPLIFGLPWRRPATILFLAVILLGGIAIYLEDTAPLGTNGASGPFRGAPHILMGMIGTIVWGLILLHMISFPGKYVKQSSLADGARVSQQRETLVRVLGYALGIATLSFAIYKILLLM